MNNLLNDSWALSGTEPRDAQKKIMTEVISAINDGYHNIIINAGTGIGKSAIAVTLANYYMKNEGWSSYILTRTTQLQEQYIEDFNHCIKDLQGKSNYKCNYGDYNKEFQILLC
jgi:Rad3-related DNA helicase